MTRRFIAIVVGAAVAVTAIGNAPARADDDVARALAAIVGLAVVGKVISDRLEDDNYGDVITRRYDNRDIYAAPSLRRPDSMIRRVDPRPLPRRVAKRLLPGHCLRSFDTRDGRYRIFGKRCLERNYDYTRSLPRACKVSFRANQKKRHGYDARCLRHEGYQLARR
ncbi:hypothetical protein [Roseobacter weihaiensis]|uniref:hypothetical protein n=1 Tax=Roseobacter weihaiensis TaxID=2763262 RepID=UPI001D0B0096|nr:hypothetical protein [Roseobacter sp. H9]